MHVEEKNNFRTISTETKNKNSDKGSVFKPFCTSQKKNLRPTDLEMLINGGLDGE